MQIFKKKPLIIAGPCSAESEEQLFKITSTLQKNNVDIIRAGIWKPRTRPGTFHGVGAVGLKWITEIKKNIPAVFTIEIATPQHVEMALKAGIDVLWIGARSTVNPFTVQGIADALRGIDIPVMVKNPINPDLSLWIGAFERLDHAGIKQIAAIHRGFSTIQMSKYRNLPLWRIPLEFTDKYPDIPLICDPSHIAGKRNLVYEIAQKAMDLDYDGLMIEVDLDPDKALSDPDQQLTPDAFLQMLKSLRFKAPDTDTSIFHQLEDIQDEIDQLDREMGAIIEARMLLVKKVGLYKANNNMNDDQIEKWKSIIESRLQSIINSHENKKLIQKIFRIIQNESSDNQNEIK
ncbi:MAG: bifunctional 3-deoxy-7-phosphoheptulonate synthase/chorismate mutase type II [Spirochaetes bacterium]|jgi:chorismate mutase|nr:bifunctional 3-deoxy-7-phosphoheptulonate synthase/chorismate mutase type II [Spirochaetota bacterium]